MAAALDCQLDLEPSSEGGWSVGDTNSFDSTPTAPALWVARQLHQRTLDGVDAAAAATAQQQQQQGGWPSEEEEEEEQQGYSSSEEEWEEHGSEAAGGGTAAACALLGGFDSDDASSPQQPAERFLKLAAASLFDDLAARGAALRYCTRPA